MLVHSFASGADRHEDLAFEQYAQFISLYSLKAKKDCLTSGRSVSKVRLYFGWVNGDPKYLER